MEKPRFAKLPITVGILRRVKKRVKEFFEIAPEHDLKKGMLVTCSCHGGVAVILELYDNGTVGYPKMNMAKIWWIVLPPKFKTRVWMHSIANLKRYDVFKTHTTY